MYNISLFTHRSTAWRPPAGLSPRIKYFQRPLSAEMNLCALLYFYIASCIDLNVILYGNDTLSVVYTISLFVDLYYSSIR